MIKSPVRGSDIAVSDIYGDGDDIAEGETLSCGSAFKGGDFYLPAEASKIRASALEL